MTISELVKMYNQNRRKFDRNTQEVIESMIRYLHTPDADVADVYETKEAILNRI
jgi:hypothetical protein